MSDTVTITVRVEDAWVLTLGPLEYVVQVQQRLVPEGGSPRRVREALAKALAARAAA